jgi:hypothetical protein
MADADLLSDDPSADYYAAGWDPYEINTRKGMPFGGMPAEMLLAKMEETPGMDSRPGETPEEAYDTHARSTIVNWGPEAPGLGEDDTSKSAGTHGVHRLNYQYFGGHGEASATGPRHPELFLDLSVSDTPGDQIRFDEARRQAARRIRVLTPAMGDNDDNHVAESPWTKVAEQRDRKAMQTWISRTRRIHGSQYVGRDPTSGVSAAESDIRKAREMAIGDQGVVGGVSAYSRDEGYHSMNRGRDDLGAPASAVARAGRTDGFFGGGSKSRTRGVERFGAHRGGEGLVHGRADSSLGSYMSRGGDLAGVKGRVVAPTSSSARSLAAGRNAVYMSKFRASEDGVAAGTGLKRPSDGLTARASVVTGIPGVAVVQTAESMQARNLGRSMRAQTGTEARRAQSAAIAQTYRAAAADAETSSRGTTAAPSSTMRVGNMMGKISQDGATYWTGDDKGLPMRFRAGREAMPDGGYVATKKAGARYDTDIRNRLVDYGAMGAGRTGAGSAYGKAGMGGNPVGRGAAPGGVVPEELDLTA